MGVNLLGYATNFLGTSQPGQPGVGSVSAGDAAQYGQPVPGQPGVFVDPRTGTQFIYGADGTPQSIQGQNLNQQTATNTGNEQVQQAQAAKLQQQQQQTLQGQNGLAASFNNTINGGTPSVADIQLDQGMNQAQGQQLAMAAGASGENAAAARRTAAQNVAGAATALNGQQALLRANETTAAQTGLANVLNSQNQTLSSGINNATGAGVQYANQAGTDQGTNSTLQEKENENNAKANSNLLGSIGNAASSIGSLL